MAFADVENFCKKLPKVELHAHLNGSLSKSTLNKLIELKKKRVENYLGITDIESVVINAGASRTLEQVFSMFPIIQNLTDTPEAVQLAMEDVVEEFYADNVYYLEVRSTPRILEGKHMKDYVIAMMNGASKAVAPCPQMVVHLLLSIDRKMDLDMADQVVNLAIENKYDSKDRPCGVVGIDLSGDPRIDGRPFIPALRKAKGAGLKTSLHLAEVNMENLERETSYLLAFGPDRIGHGTFMRPEHGGNQEYVHVITAKRTPIELCLTSNVKCGTVDGFSDHHFGAWFSQSHPIVLCTDDKGIFHTSLSQEYELAAKAFHLDKASLYKLSLAALDFLFEPSAKGSIIQIWTKFKEHQSING